MKTLIAYPVSEEAREGSIYIVDKGREQEEAYIIEQIFTHKPDVLVVGNNKITAGIISAWRNICRKQELTIIRRGTSLAGIDLAAAKENGITVLNTPGINAPALADYIIKNIGDISRGVPVGVIGSGQIGARVARIMSANGHPVYIWSPNIATKHFGDNINICNSAAEVALRSQVIAIAVNALPVKQKVTPALGMDFAENLQSDARIINISETHVFGEGVLPEIYKKAEVFFDSLPADVKLAKALPNSEKARFASNAMQTEHCRHDLDYALQALLAQLEIRHLGKTLLELAAKAPAGAGNIGIAGAGPMAIIMAHFLNLQGRQVEIFAAERQLQPAGGPSRHISATEQTKPVAAGLLTKSLNEYGWSVGEKAPDEWQRKFESLDIFPEMQKLLTSLVTTINLEGLKLWQQFFAGNIDFTPALISKKFVRVFTSEQAFTTGLKFQMEANPADNFEIYGHNQLLSLFPGMNLTTECKGIKVEGLAVDLQKFSEIMLEKLQANGVRINWGQRVQKITPQGFVLNDGTSRNFSHMVNATGATSTALLNNGSYEGKVQPIAGIWYKLPNINGYTEAVKIHTPIGVMNITPSIDGKELNISNGFALTGDKEKLGPLEILVAEYIRSYLPAESAAAGELKASSHCFRAGSATGVPIIGKDGNITAITGGGAGTVTQAWLLGAMATLSISEALQDKAPNAAKILSQQGSWVIAA